MAMLNGWFTIGSVTFITETERKDGKGSYLSVYIRFGADKSQVTKAKVWAANYRTLSDGFALKTEEGFVPVSVGDALTAWGSLSSYKFEGNERVGYVIELVEGVDAEVLTAEDLEARSA